MNPEQRRTCEYFSFALVRKISGELPPEDKEPLESHLAQCMSCSAEEQKLTGVWQRLDNLTVPEISAQLYQKTRDSILRRLNQERSVLPLFERIPLRGLGSALIPVFAGLTMTGVSYALVHKLIDRSIHHDHILLLLFSLWWLLFAGCSWLIVKRKREALPRFDAVVACSISITLLTLLISFLTYEVDFLRWLAGSAAYQLAAASHSLFGLGNTFITSWWIYCCLASFMGAFVFGVSRPFLLSQNLFLGSLLIMVLLSPAIYLQGSSHNHGFGMIAFAVFGTYVGSLVGTSLGLFIRRQFAFQAA